MPKKIENNQKYYNIRGVNQKETNLLYMQRPIVHVLYNTKILPKLHFKFDKICFVSQMVVCFMSLLHWLYLNELWCINSYMKQCHWNQMTENHKTWKQYYIWHSFIGLYIYRERERECDLCLRYLKLWEHNDMWKCLIDLLFVDFPFGVFFGFFGFASIKVS